jgi:lysophospholipase L1-like esterase
VLQTLLGAAYNVSNYGNSGKTMLTNGWCNPPPSSNCSYVGTPTWPAALVSQPDIVTIMLGTNDAKEFNWFGIQDNSADSYVLDYVSMIHTLRQLKPAPLIVVLSLVPLYTPFPYEMNATVINTMLSAPGGILFQIAALEADAIIDVHGAFVQTGFGPNITCDGCHPVDQGYEFIASVLATGIRKLNNDDAPLPTLESVREQYGTPAFEEMAASVNMHARKGSFNPSLAKRVS